MSSLCAPSPTKILKRFYECRKCKSKKLHDLFLYEWYEPLAKCRKCGTMIQFGEYK